MLEKIFAHPLLLKRLEDIKGKVYNTVGTLSVEASKSKEPIMQAEKESLVYSPIKKGEKWGEEFDCCWFHMKGTIPEICKDKHTVAIININGEGAIYDNDKVTQGITQVLSVIDIAQTRIGKQIVELKQKAEGNEKIDLYVDAGYNGVNGVFVSPAKFNKADIAIVNDLIFDYYYDFLTMFLLIATYGTNDILTKERKKEVEKLLNVSYIYFSRTNYEKASKIIKKAYDKNIDYEDVVYTAIGHAHLDLAWKWPVRESKRKAIRTLSTALKNIDKYPNYIFGASQAQMFDWVKNDQPELYERVKEAAQKGRIEVQGNMWTECDCNIPNGESIIRQFMYGDKFFIGEMGICSKMVWLPDVFGFPATMPQIIKGVGKEYFMTIKLSWNKYNKFPLQSFRWIGDDGSEIVCHIAPEGVYNSSASPFSITTSNKKNVNKETGKALLIYGVGDGGAGPGEGHLELLEREKSLYGLNKVKQASAQSFFEDLEKCDLKEYSGELYLEKHQGTLTSQGANKLYNRLVERELHNIEWLKAVTGNDINLDEIWKEMLLYQFHDIIPGSSINRVYKESIAGYEKMYQKLMDIEDNMVNSLSDKEGLSVINPTSFYRKEYVKAGKEWFLAECEPYSTGELNSLKENDLKHGNTYIENDSMKLIFDKKGVIVSMFDKIKKCEYAKEGLNNLNIYNDPKTHYNAWDIKDDYMNKKPTAMKLVDSHSYIDGASVVMENNYIYNKSTINQKVILTDNIVNFDTKVNWHEKNKMLRAEFYPTIYSDKVNCDIQFGSIDRSTKNENDIEKAQFEVCAHKYVAMQNSNGYFALINDCKYGHRVKDGLVSLNLLRSPKYPDKECDMGMHSFGYEIVVCNDIKEVVEQSYIYNNPLILVEKDLEIEPIIKVDNENIIIETIKNAEDGKGVIIRLYERYGNVERVNLRFNRPYSKIYECNLLEENRIETTDVIELTPHQIKTVYIEY
jgi:alpha-mannosidase